MLSPSQTGAEMRRFVFRCASDLRQGLARVKSNGPRKGEIFDHVNPALPALKIRDPGLGLLHPLGNIDLA